MTFERLNLREIVLCTPNLIKDDRGYFAEVFRLDLLTDFLGTPIHFCQENQSASTKNVFRGLHYQKPPFEQAKLITVIKGTILDVVLDIRKDSPTFGEHLTCELNGTHAQSLFIPKGFAHGFLVKSEEAIIRYKVDAYYSPVHDAGIHFKDPTLNIDLGVAEETVFCSVRDLNHPFL